VADCILIVIIVLVYMIYGIALTSVGFLFPQFCLSNSFWNCLSSWVRAGGRHTTWCVSEVYIRTSVRIVGWVEEMSGRDHHLVLTLTCLNNIWSFALIYQIKQMGLILICRGLLIMQNRPICSVYPVWSHTVRHWPKCTSHVSLRCCWIWIIIIRDRSENGSIAFDRLIDIVLASFSDETVIEHRLSHLILLRLATHIWISYLDSCKTPHSGLVENVVFWRSSWLRCTAWHLSIVVDCWEHVVDSRVVCTLQQYSLLSLVEFIDTQRTVSSLLPHSVCHEESLVWFLSSKPMKLVLWNHLHSVYSLHRRLTLSCSKILPSLLHQSLNKRVVRHRVLVVAIILL